MQQIHASMSRRRHFLSGTFYEYLIVAIIFFAVTLFLTNFTLLSGTNKLFIDGPGDGTAGFLWFNTVETDASPILGQTDMANYPQGEQLFNPTQVTYTLVWGPLWILSKLLGPVMGLNIVTFFGILLCAYAGYWLVKKLTNNPFVAFFAGYAMAFTPYHLVKSSSHLTYIFSVVFVLMIAAFIGYWKKPTIKRAILLATTLAIAFYTDGYFILIGGALFACLIIGGLIYDYVRGDFWNTLKMRLRHGFIALCILGAMLVPIVVVQAFQGEGVNKFLSGARGNIAFDIEYYSTKPIDFLVPSSLNPFLKDNPEFQKIVAAQNKRSNTSENNTYIGYILIALVSIGLIVLVRHWLIRKKSRLGAYAYRENFKLVYIIGIVAVPILVWCMLSPSLKILGISTITLADILLHFDISLWRVVARFYLPLHAIFVLMAAVSLAYIVSLMRTDRVGNKRSRIWRVCAVAVIVLALAGTAAEYSTALSTTSYDFRKLPAVYTRIRDDDSIKVVAELPLIDRPLSDNYNFATAQIVHGKKLINTPLTNNVPGTRTALGSSIEAVDYAIIRGADTIITHNLQCRDTTWGEVKYVDLNQPQTNESSYYGSPICVYAVKQSYVPDDAFAVLRYGTFSDALITSGQNEYQPFYMEDGWLNVADASGRVIAEGTSGVHFTADIQYSPKVQGNDLTEWEVYQGESLLAKGKIPGRIDVSKIDPSQPIHVRAVDPSKGITKPFMISLSSIVVTKN